MEDNKIRDAVERIDKEIYTISIYVKTKAMNMHKTRFESMLVALHTVKDLAKAYLESSGVMPAKVENPNCYCDGSGKDVNGFCNCEFSKNEIVEACTLVYTKLKMGMLEDIRITELQAIRVPMFKDLAKAIRDRIERGEG